MTGPCSGTTATGGTAVTPRSDPFTSLAAHFGMLLGVPDLEVLSGHAWAKVRLHNAWLHGAGVVCGFGLEVDGPSREVRVAPGLALDPLGRELHLPVTSCLDLARWYDEHEDELTTTTEDGRIRFDAHVVARARACLSRPVPALVDPCEGAGADTAYSRVQETVELHLRPGLPDDPPVAYPRLRRLLGLPGSDDPAVVDDVEAARADLPGPEAFARLAALDTAALAPSGGTLFPGEEPGDVVLGVLRGLSLGTAEPVTADVDEIDLGARLSHVATADLATLLAPGAGAGGPRLDPASAALSGRTLTVTSTGPLLAPTLEPATSVTVLDPATGWADVAAVVTFDDATSRLRLELATAPAAGALVRVVVRGTGPDPAMGTGPDGALLPLAGTTGGPPGTTTDGADAVLHLEGS
jgi:hypothetical protein